MKRWFGVFFAAVLLVLCVLYAPAAADGARAGLALAAHSALPALFPFFVVGGLTVRTGLADDLGRLLEKPCRRLFGLPGTGAAALALGLLGGYPVGAQTAARLYAAGALTKRDAERLLTFANCAGPAFLISFAGAGLFGSVQTGALLYAIHAGAALLVGLTLPQGEAVPIKRTRKSEALAPALVASIGEAGDTALRVTAFIVFFSVLLALWEETGLLSLLGGLLDPLFPGAGAAAAAGLLELTNGLSRLAGCGAKKAALLPLVSGLAGFGGLSVHCQTLAILAGSGLPAGGYLRGKALHGLFAFLLALLPGADGGSRFAISAGTAVFILFLKCYGKRRQNHV